MKKEFDASYSHQTVYHINRSDKYNPSELNLNFLNKKYSKYIDLKTNENRPDYFIQSVYVNNSESNFPIFSDNYKSCFACDYAMFIIDLIENNYVSLNEDGYICSEFYSFLVKSGKAICSIYGIDDLEMAEIFSKQIIILLKKMGVVVYEDRRAKIKTTPLNMDMYESFFSTFWNSVSWSDIFPSVPEAGLKFQMNRDKIIKILLSLKGKESLENVALEFILQSGMSLRNEVLLISYLDFSIFNWLNYFGIIKYVDCSASDSVMIELTDTGRHYLSNL